MARLLSEENLRNMFRERYLKIHEPCLKSISDLIYYNFIRNSKTKDKTVASMVETLQTIGKLRGKRVDPEDYESPYFRDLRNSWYHELTMGATEIRLAAWKIVQAYYTVFSSASALVRCHDVNATPGHLKILRTYNNRFVTETSKRFLLPPATLFLNEDKMEGLRSITWPYGLEEHVPNIEAGMKWAKRELERIHDSKVKIVTIPTYLMALREWVNYSDAYLFFMLYGQSVRANLEAALGNITNLYLVQAEYYMIALFGIDTVEFQFSAFRDQLKMKLGLASPSLETRFGIYRSMLA